MTRTLRTLVVDDEPGLCTGVERVLRRLRVEPPEGGEPFGFATDTAKDAAEARQRWTAETYDLFLLDYRLPDASGLDLLRELRERDGDALAIVITAFASLEVAVSATKNGAFDFLSKPFTPEELESVVRKAVRQLLLQRRARALEEERRRTRFEFLSVLAHELKAPLGAVESYLRILKDRVLGERVSDYETQIDRSLVRVEGMRKMIYDLLDLTRIESGEKRRDVRPLDLVGVARIAIEMFAADAAARRVTVALDAPDPVELRADRGEMEIILNNLITNAIKYNREGGRVEVVLRREDDRAVVRVRDTGIGMTEAECARLFSEFVRIKNEQTLAIPGSGLGLSIVRKLALLYNGETSVQSRPGEGSVFTVALRSLPAAPDADASIH